MPDVATRRLSVAFAKSQQQSECHMRTGSTYALNILKTCKGSDTCQAHEHNT